MPNHCQNDLHLLGPADRIEELLKFIGATDEKPLFDFNRIIPEPKSIRHHDPQWMTEIQINWRRANWNTKWTGYDLERSKRDGHECLKFETAWAPPTPVIVALHKLFPDLTFHFEYFEMGMGKCGGFTLWSETDGGNYELEDWAPGAIRNEWSGEYRGHRGG